MRYVARCAAFAVAAAAIAACSSSSDATDPSTDPFSGAYTLSTVGGVGLPRRTDTNATTGGYDVLRSGALSFPDGGRIIVSSTRNSYSTATASAVSVTETDTFDLGRLPAQGFLLRTGEPADTVAGIIVPAINQLALDYRTADGLGTYLFVRH